MTRRVILVDELTPFPTEFLRARLSQTDIVVHSLKEETDMSIRPRMLAASMLAAAFGLVGDVRGEGVAVMDHLASCPDPTPRFSERYGSNPQPINKGARGHAARQKRASAKRRNIAKRNRSASQ